MENTTISMTTLTTVNMTRIITSLTASFPPAVTPGVHVRVNRKVTKLNIVQPMARVTILLPDNIMLPSGRPSAPTTVSTMNTFYMLQLTNLMMLHSYGPSPLPVCRARVLVYYNRVKLMTQANVMVTSTMTAVYGRNVVIPLTTDRQNFE